MPNTLKPRRDTSLDALRGFALCSILIAHSVFYTLDMPGLETTIWAWSNGYAPIIFALLIGYSYSLSRNQTVSGIALRGGLLFLVGLALSTISNYVLVILPILGLGMIATSWILKVPPWITGIVGVLLLSVDPIISWSVLPHMTVYPAFVPTLTNLMTPEGLLSIIWGTYPLIQWIGLIMLGYCVYHARHHIDQLPAMLYLLVAILCIATGVLFADHPSFIERLNPITSMEVALPDVLLSPYGHTGSYISEISALCLGIVLYKVFRAVPQALTYGLSACGYYSLTAYIATTLILLVTHGGNWLFGIVVVTLVLFVCSFAYRRGWKDMMSYLLGASIRTIQSSFAHA